MRLIDADNLFNNQILVVSNSASLEVIEKIMDIIKEAPTVDAEPVRHGRWEHGREISRGYIGDACIGVQYEDWKCSNCGIVCEQSDKPKYKYCPVCGCKMDLDEVNDEVKDT